MSSQMLAKSVWAREDEIACGPPVKLVRVVLLCMRLVHYWWGSDYVFTNKPVA